MHLYVEYKVVATNKFSLLLTSQTGKQIITRDILPKDNQTMKFGQSIKYNMRNIFLEKSYTKW